MPKRNINDNPIQSHYDDKFNGIKKAEENGSFPGADGKSGVDGVRDAESNPGKGYINNVVGKSLAKSSGPMSFIKKKSPMLAIIITLAGGAIGLGSLSSSTLLPMAIVSNLVQKFNPSQETSLTIRTNKLLASKMSKSLTSGSCDVVKIACRFSLPSNQFLSQLEKNGISAIDKNGSVIKSSGIFPNARPASYEFTNEAGETITVEAKNLAKTLDDNPELRSAFHTASKTRFESLTDSVFDYIKQKFGFTTSDKLASTSDADSLASSADDATTASNSLDDVIDDNVKVDDSAATTALADGSDEAIDAAGREIISDTADDAVNQVADSGAGDTTGLVAGLACAIADTPTMVTGAVRGFQMTQLIKYSAVFLSAFGAIKAGDAKPAEVSAVASSLTNVSNGKSAMDSFGMAYIMTASVSPSNNNYKKFAPGGSLIAKLGGFTSLADSQAKKDVCSALTNPTTGQSINLALASNSLNTFGASLGAAALNIGTALVIQQAMETLGPPIIDAVVKLIPMKEVLSFFVGDLTKNLVGEDIGNALVSGASQTMGQTANSGGNMPLTVKQAVAYRETTKKVQLAYAEEDRATKSPLDTSSPNTMLGSILYGLVPYTYSLYSNTSISNTLATIGKMVTGSFSAIFQPVTASATSGDESEYQLCDDPSIKNNDTAAGPFCNIMYGIPTEYLDKDPVSVVNSLVNSGEVDANTGEPIAGKELAKWVELCTDGTTMQAQNCKINDETRANYALYTVDHRIQKSMDDAPSDSSDSSSSNTASTVSTGTVKYCTENYGKNDSQAGMKRVYGSTKSAIESDLVDVEFPFKSGNKTIKFNKKAAPCLKAVVQDLSSVSFRPTTFDGSFSWRPNRNNPSQLSYHSFGVALDLDAAKNPNGGGRPGNCKTNMPANFVAVFKKYGFRWGGDYHSTCDAMHFEWLGG